MISYGTETVITFALLNTNGTVNTTTDPATCLVAQPCETIHDFVAATNAPERLLISAAATCCWKLTLTTAEMSTAVVLVKVEATGCIPVIREIRPEQSWTAAKSAYVDASINTVDGVVDAIKLKTDGLNFTGAEVQAVLGTGGITATTIATGAIDADAIATDALGSLELATTAVTEIVDAIEANDLGDGGTDFTYYVKTSGAVAIPGAIVYLYTDAARTLLGPHFITDSDGKIVFSLAAGSTYYPTILYQNARYNDTAFTVTA